MALLTLGPTAWPPTCLPHSALAKLIQHVAGRDLSAALTNAEETVVRARSSPSHALPSCQPNPPSFGPVTPCCALKRLRLSQSLPTPQITLECLLPALIWAPPPTVHGLHSPAGDGTSEPHFGAWRGRSLPPETDSQQLLSSMPILPAKLCTLLGTAKLVHINTASHSPLETSCQI